MPKKAAYHGPALVSEKQTDSGSPMAAELDHLYIFVSEGAPEADHVAALGMTEGPPNQHPGQGTACRRFFFANAYLELLWVANEEEVKGEVASPLRFWERWSGRAGQTSPFGILLRSTESGNMEPPFPSWEFRPPYFPSGIYLHMGTNAESLTEPLLGYFHVARRDEFLQRRREMNDIANRFQEVTALRIFGPQSTPPSAALLAAMQTGAFTFHQAPEHRAEFGFDGEGQGQRADLRPVLPLVIYW